MLAQSVCKQSLLHEAFQDRLNPLDWKVEAINSEFGDVYVALFSGPLAKERAIQYAELMNRNL
jgi:hypothetical protein